MAGRQRRHEGLLGIERGFHRIARIDVGRAGRARDGEAAVEAYRDEAEGVLAEGPTGKQMMTRVALRPEVTFSGDRRPTPQELSDLHHRAHEECFIANSVTSEVVIDI